MGRLVLTVFLICGFLCAAAQNNSVRLTLNILPPYSTSLTDYRPSASGPGKLIVTIQNLSSSEQRVYIRAEIRGEDNGVRIYTAPDYTPVTPIVISPMETRQLFPSEIMDIYDPNRLVYIGTDQRQIRNSDRVPEGAYSICLRAFDHTPGRTQIPLSEGNPSGCATIYMRDNEPPMLIQPFQDAQLPAFKPQNVIFSWTQPVGTDLGTRYRLRIVEMFEGDGRRIDPNVNYEASGSPIFDQEVMGNTYVYGPADHALVPGRRYAWAVTALGSDGRAFYRNDGRSEVRAFLYKDSPTFPQLATVPQTVPAKKNNGGRVVLSKVHFAKDTQVRDLVLNSFKGKLVWAFRKSESGHVPEPPPAAVTVPGFGGTLQVDQARSSFSAMEMASGAMTGQNNNSNNAPVQAAKPKGSLPSNPATLYAFGGGKTAFRVISHAVPQNQEIQSVLFARQRHQARILSLADEKRYPLSQTSVSLYLRKKEKSGSPSETASKIFWLNGAADQDILLGQTTTNQAGEFVLNYLDEIPEGYDAYLKIDNKRFEFADYDIPLVANQNGTYDFGELVGLAKTYRLRVKVVNQEGSELDLATVRLERPKNFYTNTPTHQNLLHEVMRDSLTGQPAEVVAAGGKSGAFWPRLFYSEGFADSYSVIIEGQDIQKTVHNLNLVDLSGLGVNLSESDEVVLLEKSFVANIPLPVVEGRVLTKNGEVPLSGAIVTVQKKGSRNGQTTRLDNGGIMVLFDPLARSATTDSLGKFKVENIPVQSGAVEVIVSYKGKKTTHDKDLYLSQRGLREVIDPLFVNAELITVIGKVVDSGGEPLADATLNWKGGGKAFFSDDAGNFIASQTEGAHTIIARKPGFRDAEYQIELKAASKQAGAAVPVTSGSVRMTSWAQSVTSAQATFNGAGQYAGQTVVPRQNGAQSTSSGDRSGARSTTLTTQLAAQTVAMQNYYDVFGDGMASGAVSTGHVIVLSKFFVRALVKDESTGRAVANAKVSAEGAVSVSLTDNSGTALVGDVPGGNAAIVVSGPEGSFYATRKVEIGVDASNDTLSIEVKLKAGAKAGGQVRQGGAPVAGAVVSVEGMEHIFTRTDNQGRYTLSGIPAGEYTLIASKEGMLADRKSEDFKANQTFTLDFSLTDPGFNASSLLGFKMVLLRSKPGSGANEFIISGELRDLPDNPVFKNAGNTGIVLRFTDKTIIKEGNGIYPKGGELVTDVSEIKLKAFGYLALTLKNANGLRVRPATPGSHTLGEVAGEAQIDWQGTFSALAGLTMPSAPLQLRPAGNASGDVIAPINSAGNVTFTSLGFTGPSEGWQLYGIKLLPDLAGSSIDQQGINLKGKIKIEGIPVLNNQELKLDRLVISKRGEIRDVSVNLNPQPTLTLVTWKLKLSGVSLNQYGLKLNGEMEMPVPSSAMAKITVKELGINGEQLTGGTFLLPSTGLDIFGLVSFKTTPGKDFTIQKIAGSTHYRFIGAGTIDLPRWVKEQIILDHFSVATNGDFSVVAQTDIEVGFADMARLGITKFGFASNVSQITVGGKFRLNIPMFGAGAEGTMYFRKGYAPRIDELGINFNLASAIALEAKLKFNETEFSGNGALKLAGIPGVGLKFWYKKQPQETRPRVGAQFLANVTIPIGVVKLDQLTGGFDFDFAQNIYSINAGGRITIAPDPYGVVALYPVEVKITSTPGGPIFEGGAGVRVLDAWTVGSAMMKLDFNKKQFYIDGEFGAGFNLVKGIDVESKSGVHLELYTGAGSNYWFVAGYSRTRILGIFDTGVQIAAGWNIAKSNHASLSGIPDYALTNGRLYGGYFGVHSSIEIKSPSVGFKNLASASVWYKNSGMAEVYANFKSGAFGLKIASEWRAGATIEVYKLGDIFSADARFAGRLEGYYKSTGWGVEGHLSGGVHGYVGCDGNCNFITWTGCFNLCVFGCKFCPIPCGFKICADASADLSYDSNKGFDISLKLFER